MGVYSNKKGTRFFIEFQYKGKRIKKWQPKGTTLEKATAVESRMLKDLKKEHEGYVYFISADGGSRFKIGFSLNPQKRLQCLESTTGKHMELLAARPGSPQTEKDIQFHFRKARSLGEWFFATDIEKDLERFMRWTPETYNDDVRTRLAEREGWQEYRRKIRHNLV